MSQFFEGKSLLVKFKCVNSLACLHHTKAGIEVWGKWESNGIYRIENMISILLVNYNLIKDTSFCTSFELSAGSIVQPRTAL